MLANNINFKKLHDHFVDQHQDHFHNIVIDNFLTIDFANELEENFPSHEDQTWWMYDNPLEKKLAFNDISKLHASFKKYFEYINSKEFLEHLQDLTGIPNLLPDPQMRGGGLHLIKPGGKLDVHEDFNIHPEMKKLRCVNLILYLNKGWRDEWGGQLELWEKNMTYTFNKISPIFNRAVIFRTDMNSNHGHPRPLDTPRNTNRISLASYYYTDIENIDNLEFRSTSYKKLPHVEDGLDDLRNKRRLGRLLNSKTNKK